MATEKQIRANRENAALSTGPRTPEGKEVSRGNALKHGLTARSVVLVGEDEEAHGALVTELVEQYQPDGPMQEQLVRRLADCLWRLQRVPALEALVLETAKYGKSPDLSGTSDHYNSLRYFVIPDDVLGKLARHEAQLFKQMQVIVKLLGDPKQSSQSCNVAQSTVASSSTPPAPVLSSADAREAVSASSDRPSRLPTHQVGAPQPQHNTGPQLTSPSFAGGSNLNTGPIPSGRGLHTTSDGIVHAIQPD